VHAVNLLPRQVASQQGGSRLPLGLIGAAAVPVIAIVLVVIGYSSANSTVASEQAKFAALEAQIAALGGATAAKTDSKSTTAEVSAAQWTALISERTARRAELDDVLNKELPWDSMLRDIARILPGDVWLTAATFTSPVPFGTAAAPAPSSSPSSPGASNFTISGFGESEKSIALLLVRLRLLPILSNVTLGTTTSTTVGAKPVVQFSVTAAIPAPPGAVLPVSPAPAATTTTTG